MWISPSSYKWLIPPIEDKNLDILVSKDLYPVIEGLLPAVGYAILFGVMRVILTSVLFKPLAKFAMKIPESKFNPLLDIELHLKKSSKSKIPNQAEIENIVYKTGRPVDEVNSYLMTRKLDRIRKSKVTKFGEAFWRFLFYSYFTFLGIQILLYPKTAEWIIDTQNHFINWPFQRIPDIIVFYHQVQLGCYIHQLMWTEVSRSDSLEMIIHHLTTITLVLISHVTMFHRVGSLTFFLHDISDVFLESAKCFNYASKAKGHELFSIISNILFGIFAISFLVLRLILYPKLVVYSVVVESRDILGVWPGYYLISTLLSILVCLHIFWFSLICNMIYRMSSGGLEKDVRSEEEEEEEEQIQQQSELKKKNN